MTVTLDYGFGTPSSFAFGPTISTSGLLGINVNGVDQVKVVALQLARDASGPSTPAAPIGATTSVPSAYQLVAAHEVLYSTGENLLGSGGDQDRMRVELWWTTTPSVEFSGVTAAPRWAASAWRLSGIGNLAAPFGTVADMVHTYTGSAFSTALTVTGRTPFALMYVTHGGTSVEVDDTATGLPIVGPDGVLNAGVAGPNTVTVTQTNLGAGQSGGAFLVAVGEPLPGGWTLGLKIGGSAGWHVS